MCGRFGGTFISDEGVRQSALGGGRIGDVTDDVGSILTKLNVVVFALLGVEPALEEVEVEKAETNCDSDRMGPNFVN